MYHCSSASVASLNGTTTNVALYKSTVDISACEVVQRNSNNDVLG